MKKIIIVGGDKVAYRLIGLLEKEKKYDIRVLDLNMDVCEKIANDFSVSVYNADGSNVDGLEKSGCENADVFIALTGKDETNVVACQIAKMNFNVKLTIAKSNNHKNSSLMEILGVDKIFSSGQILAQMIDQEVAYSGMTLAYNIPGNSKAIISVPLSPLSPAEGKTLQDFKFIGDSRVVLVTDKQGEAIIPTGSLVMQGGDTLLMVSDQSYFEEIWKVFIRPELLSEEEHRNYAR